MKLEMMQEKKTVIASAGMHKYAFVKAAKLAETLGGDVSTTDLQARFKATFKSAKVAKKFVTEWTAQYEQALADKQAKAEEKAKKVASGKGKKKSTKATPRKRKPTSVKGDASTKPTWQTEVDAYAGKGRKANHDVAAILRKHNMSAQIGSEGWTYWEGVR